MSRVMTKLLVELSAAELVYAKLGVKCGNNNLRARLRQRVKL